MIVFVKWFADVCVFLSSLCYFYFVGQKLKHLETETYSSEKKEIK